MKKFNLILAVALLSVLPACNNDLWDSIHGIENQITTLDARVTRLEELCKEMNTNITALQTIVNVLQTNDYITSVTEVKKGGEVIGYTITFGKHNPITIYHGENGTDGKDGKDGIDGTNGQDGHTPVIGVAQDTDGIYYWTLDGEWLLDDNGNKLRVTGENGADGTNGTNGTNGTDGITPQLKIENDYWYISYDNGATWTQLGKAKGDKGDNGTNGTNGQDGDSMFQSVTQDEDNVYFTLENGTIITVSKGNLDNVPIVDGAIKSEFSISTTKKVYFSKGNLQFNAANGTHKCADGKVKNGTWRFAEDQLDAISSAENAQASETYDGWIDRFGWATSGWHHPIDDLNIHYEPWSTSNGGYPSNKTSNLCGYGPSRYYVQVTDGNYYGTLPDSLMNYDWGVYNAIVNGGNEPEEWRTLTQGEWLYIMESRRNASILKMNVYIDGNKGCIIFPDDFEMPTSLWWLTTTDHSNELKVEEWKELEKRGAVFLRDYCWLMQIGGSERQWPFGNYIGYSEPGVNNSISYVPPYNKYYVRLIKDVE